MDKETLLKYEPKLARLFINSRKSNRLAGAYLLYGKRNAPLKETAIYLAESLGCEKDLLACKKCPSCKRFEEGIRPDFMLIDGENNLIKREQVQQLEDRFSLSSKEKGHRLTYVIHRIENAKEETLNALLKFLEEPREGQIAFLTSYNLDRVLPTILSRCISVRVDPMDPVAFKEDLMNTTFQKEKSKKKIRLTDGQAYLLSQLYSDRQEVEEILLEDDSFLDGYNAAETFLNDLMTSYKQGAYSLLRQNNELEGSKCYNWLYLTLNEVFTDALIPKDKSDNPFNEIIQRLRKYPKAVSQAEDVVKDALANRSLNYNQTALFGRLLLALEEVNS